VPLVKSMLGSSNGMRVEKATIRSCPDAPSMHDCVKMCLKSLNMPGYRTSLCERCRNGYMISLKAADAAVVTIRNIQVLHYIIEPPLTASDP